MPTLEDIKEKLYITNEYGVSYQDPDAVLEPSDAKWLESEFGIKTDRHRSCINCQARQIIKYSSKIDDKTGQPIRDFRVPCKGIPKSLPPGSGKLYRQMVTDGMEPERAQLVLMSAVDPVSWASMMFGFDDTEETWHLRNYQKEQLRCTSEKMVIREGRRSGKTFIIALKLLNIALTREVQKGRHPAGHPEAGQPIISGPEIMVVTPFQSQLLNIFDEMEKLLKRNGDLMKQVTTSSGGSLYVKTPFFHMDFSNGAEIRGFVSGVATKSDGSGGGTMRGQNANVVYVDEMDMVPEETLDKVVIPILLTDLKGEVTFIATSTPIGKRGKFYEWCKDDPAWKEDHLPSTVLPQWEKNKSTFEAEGNEESFLSEYMALFIDAAYGVFKPGYVYNCMKDYKYEDAANLSWWKSFAMVPNRDSLVTCIGVDWNKNAGTEFVVVQYDPHNHKFVVVDVVNVSSSEFSSMRWKEELVRLNYKWKPDYIYADEGYGHTIIEDLKIMSFNVASGPKKTRRDVETAKLKDRLVSFNFSSKVELRSPIDGTPISKSGKDFIVEYAIRVLEDGILWFPESEKQLRKEMLNYVILRRSPTTNKPVYGPENDNVGDHRLDALMLALGGIQLQNGMYSNKSLALSTPKFLDRDVLEERARRAQEGDAKTPGEKVLGILRRQQTTFPGSLTLLQSMRQGETPQEAMARMKQNGQSPARVGTRSRGKMGKEETVAEWLKGKAADYRGYESDTEHLYEESRGFSSHAVPRRRSRSRGGITRRRK